MSWTLLVQLLILIGMVLLCGASAVSAVIKVYFEEQRRGR